MKPKFFDLAKKMSLHSTHHQFRIGCAIVRGNQIVSLGFNKIKTHPKAKTPYRQLHAEITAILAADKRDLRGCEVYTFREHKDGTLAIAKPCVHCQMALAEVGIGKAHFTTDGGHEEMTLSD
jgi:deoxycytidylate deaminase